MMTLDSAIARINRKKNVAALTDVSGSVRIRKMCRRHDAVFVGLADENDSERDLLMDKRLERS